MSAVSILSAAGLENTVWGQRIINAEATGGFESDDITEAGMWATCACGRLDDGIPRDLTTGAPLDAQLIFLGSDFAGHISLDEFARAAYALVNIEERAAFILSAGGGS